MSGPIHFGNVISGSNLLVWGQENIDDNTINQAEKASRLPFVKSHVALMPDAHVGIGATVGSVIPTQGAIIPAAVGVDIGCGMIAAKMPIRAEYLPDDLSEFHSRLERVIPAGVGVGKDRPVWGGDLFMKENQPWALQRSDKMWKKATSQLGTLGSGNHFFELCLDENDQVWLVLHSGSRGVGNLLAQQHMKKAKGLMRDWFIELDDPDLAYLVQGTPEFKEYVHDVDWAQEYALLNRELMMDAAIEQLSQVLQWGISVEPMERINCHHNFVQMENHHGTNMWITRKGAIKADVDDRGVIPGSMGAASYIVSGLGNPASYNSCSHGAGRAMSRTKAKQELSEGSLRALMEGIEWDSRHASKLVDEHPLAYKNIDEVMAAQADLVRIEHTLHQILNLKGT